MVYILQQGTIYGPILSRRYGHSLGINLMPDRFKLCSFDCVYCHYGPTHKCILDVAEFAGDLPAVSAVVRDLALALQRPGPLDQITFSGNGEPTLHPEFGEIVAQVVSLRDKHRPQAKVALLSNSTGLVRAEVRDALQQIDRPILKLDAGTPETFQAINRPAAGVDFAEIVAHLESLSGIFLQTVLLDGTPSNTDAENLAAYFALLTKIAPVEVHLYSIDRPVANRDIQLVRPARLQEIAKQATAQTGVPVKAFFC